jgi:hypothetical protein
MNTLEVFGIIFIFQVILEAILIYKYRYQVRKLIINIVSEVVGNDFRTADAYGDFLAQRTREQKQYFQPRDSRGRFAKTTA